MSQILCIVVHAGAGFHSKRNEKEYNNLCSKACQIASQAPDGYSALNAVVDAVVCLEDNSLTNAGLGSSLSLNGTVECDAGVMSGLHLRFAGVGSLQKIRNPIKLAHHLLDSQLTQPKDPLSRIHPSLLVGDGAIKWAISRGYHIDSCSDLTTEKTRASWKKYRRWLCESQLHGEQKDSLTNQEDRDNERVTTKKRKQESCLDTVGAVCVDKSGNIASAVSSGGIALKYEGRLGQACIYGCGCWAEHAVNGRIGIVTSGTGEQLIRTQLAQRSAERILNSNTSTPEALHQSLTDGFLSSRFLSPDEQAYAGFAGVFCQYNDDVRRSVEIFYGHTTSSMSIGYYIPKIMTSPKAFVSRKPITSSTRIETFAYRL